MSTNPARTFEELRGTLGEYGQVARRRWRLGLVGLTVVSALAFWQSQHVPRTYRANTVFERRDDVVLRNLVHGNSPYTFDSLKSTLNLDLTGSRALADAATEIGLLPEGFAPPQGALPNDARLALEDTLARYRLAVTVNLVQSSPGLDTIRLNCEARDPAVAQRFLMALRDHYISQTRERMTEVLVSAQHYFEAELARVQRDMSETTRTLREDFEDFPGVDPVDVSGAGARLEALRQEQDRLAESQAGLEAQIAAREQFLASTLSAAEAGGPAEPRAADGTISPALAESCEVITAAIRDVERELTDALTIRRMTEQHPSVLALQHKRETLLATRENVLATGPPPVPGASPGDGFRRSVAARYSAERLRIELELDALRRQVEPVRAQHAKAERRAEQFAALYDKLLRHGDEWREVRGRLEQDAASVAMWRQSLGQINRILSAESGQRGTQFTLIEEPTDAQRPVSPRVAAVFTACSGAGIACAVVLMALAELLDRSFRSVGQVTRVLGVPVVECVGVISTPRVRRRRFVERLLWTPTLVVLLLSLLLAGALAYASLQDPATFRGVLSELRQVTPSSAWPTAAQAEPKPTRDKP